MQRRYGFFTAVAMIVGIVIGSGIFFKSDNVLLATGGNIYMGILLFLLSATGIIFGALAVAELAKRSSQGGGLVAYAEEFYSPAVAGCFGWFQTFMYYPALQAVVSWVVGVYMCMLFPIPPRLEYQMAIGVATLIVLYLLNLTAPKIAGYLQVSATVIKVLPLIFLAFAGLFLGEGQLNIPPAQSEGLVKLGFMAGIAPVAFAFDGWIASTSIAKELKNEKRDLTLALIIAPIFILALYLLYFIGITKLVGAEQIMLQGDNHVYIAAERLLGGMGARIVVVFVLISVIGTCNGLILGHTRMPYALAVKNMIFGGKYWRKTTKNGLMVNSSLFSFGIAMIWMVAHYLSTKFSLTGNSDISEIAVVAQYLMYIVLYYQVFKLWRAGTIKSKFKGIVVPLFATFGAVFTFIGGFSNPLFLINLGLVAVLLVVAFIYQKRHKGDHSIPPDCEHPLAMWEISPSDSIDIALDVIEGNKGEDTDQ